jgi:probable phosphoglycerate mutase
VGERLARVKIRAIYTSPLERAIETAEPLARRHGLTPQRVEQLGEIRFGEWEGLTMEELERREDWRLYNSFRSGASPPGGEYMLETQARMVRQLECLRARHAGETVAVVSHGDPLRGYVAHCLGVPLDLMLRFDISPGSISVVEAAEWGARVVRLNDTGDLPI